MKKILKYLKPFKFMIFAIIIMVAVQSIGELYMPNLMSDIINNGISKVEYSIDKNALKNAIVTGQIPELTAMLESKGITKEYLAQNGDEVINSLKSNAISADDSQDLKSMSAEEYKLFQKMLSFGIIEAKNVSDMEYIKNVGTKMIIVAFVITGVTIIASYLSSKISMGYGKLLREKIFEKVTTFSQGDINKFGTPSLITRTTNDVTQVQNAVVMVLRMMIMVPIMCIGSIFMAINKDKTLSWILAVSVPVLFAILGIVMKKAVPLFKSLQVKLDKLNQIMREQLSGVKVIRAFDKDEYERKRFEKSNKDNIDTAIKVNRIISILMPAMTIILNFTTIAIVWFGAKRIDAGNMQIGDMMAFIQYAMHVLFSFVMATVMFVLLPRAFASGDRISEVLDVVSDIKNKEKITKNNNHEGVVEFKNVNFKYPDSEGEFALENISFKTHPGKVTAIIGSTGSSKTTILNLISRYYDVTDGEILVDNVNVKDYALEDLRNRIGYVPQKAFLFSGTIKDNILYGKESATNEEVLHALEVAQISDYVSGLDEGIMSHVAQGGNNFSGGQKQRLSIARAIAKNPNIYVFDDSFSALDFKTDAKLRQELSKIVKNKTVLIVAQRISTIMNADKIIVLNEGNIVGIGTHKELMKKCKIYKEIALSQLSKEELENA